MIVNRWSPAAFDQCVRLGAFFALLACCLSGCVQRRYSASSLPRQFAAKPPPDYSTVDLTTWASPRRDENQIQAGDRLTEGSVNPQDMLRILGVDAVHSYLVTEVQQVYRAQGVNINDKHIEVIVRQMLRRVRIESSGDSEWLPGELVERHDYQEINNALVAESSEPASAQPVLLGVTKASLSQDSWLSAASFQETTRVLTQAAIEGSVDGLSGLKENVIIGKLIPARAKVELPPLPEPTRVPLMPQAGEASVFQEDMEGLSEELMRELGFGFEEQGGSEEAREPVAVGPVSGYDEDTGGYIAEPDEES